MTNTAQKIKAFVIGPIGDRDDPHGSPRRIVFEEAIQVLEEVITPACTSLDIEVIRADLIARSGEITEQIFRQIRDAHVAIADLTGANPNVMYELGLRHTTGKLTIQLGERGRLPFDISAIRTIMFKRSEGGLAEARRLLVQALAVGLESGSDPVAATRVWFERPEDLLPESQNTTASNPDDDIEPGFLEKLADSEEGMVALGQALTTAGSIIEEITRVFVEGTAKTKALEGGYGASGARLAIANRVAALLASPAERLQIVAAEYITSIDRTEPGIFYMIDQIRSDPIARAQAGYFLHAMRSLVDSAEPAINAPLEFKEMIDGIGGATRSLNSLARKISPTLRSLSESSRRVANWKAVLETIGSSEN